MKVAHLNGLRAFEATLRNGNFRAAAAELGVTPAAVGQQVRALEDYLGRKLFIRSKNGATPTSDAVEAEDELREGMIALENVLGNLPAKKRVQRLKLTIDQPFFEMWLGTRFAQFQAQHPNIEIATDISYRMVDLLAEDFDFAVRFAGEQPEVFDSVTLFEVGVLAVCTADFAARYNLPRHPKSLQGVPLFHIHTDTDNPRAFGWQDWCDLHGVQTGDMRQGQQFTRLKFRLQLAQSGMALALCGAMEANVGLKDGSIVMPFDRKYGRKSLFKYRLVSVRGRRRSKAHRLFRDWIIKCGAEFQAEIAPLMP